MSEQTDALWGKGGEMETGLLGLCNAHLAFTRVLATFMTLKAFTGQEEILPKEGTQAKKWGAGSGPRGLPAPGFLPQPWPVEVIASHTLKQMKHPRNHPFFSLAHDGRFP